MSQSYNVSMDREFGTGPSCNAGQQPTGLSPMQRWLAEAPRDSPYHTIQSLVHSGSGVAQNKGINSAAASSSNGAIAGSYVEVAGEEGHKS